MSIFDLFRKKPSHNEVVSDVACTLIKTQLMLASIEDVDVESDFYILGYIFGTHDAICQNMVLERDDDMLSAMSFSYEVLFGTDRGRRLLSLSLQNETNDLFMKGRLCGGDETMQFIQTKRPPLGISKYKNGL